MKQNIRRAGNWVRSHVKKFDRRKGAIDRRKEPTLIEVEEGGIIKGRRKTMGEDAIRRWSGLVEGRPTVIYKTMGDRRKFVKK